MKVDTKKLLPGYNPYMDISFTDLMNLIFTPGGECRSCDPKAVTALIIRLENHYPACVFGNRETGEINEMDLYLTGAMLLNSKKHRKNI